MPYVRRRRRRRTRTQKFLDAVSAHPWIGISALTLLAAVLRLYGLDAQSLSHDELSTWARTEYPGIKGLLEYGVRTDFHPPGHFLLIWCIKQLGFDSSVAMRLPSAIAGTLCVPLLIRIGQRFFDRATAWLAATMMAISWCMVFYSQDARAYTSMVFTGLLTLDATIAIVHTLRRSERPSRALWAQLILAGTVTAYLHYYGLFFVGLMGMGALACLLPRVGPTLTVATGFTTVGLTYLPWLTEFIEDLGRNSSWLTRHGIGFFPRWWQWIFGEALLSALAAAVLLGLGIVVGIKKWRTEGGALMRGETAAVILWLGMPAAVAFMKSWLSTPALSNKNLLLCAPAAYLLVAHSVVRLPIHALARIGIGLLFVGWMLVDLVGIKDYHQTPHKRQYREAVAAVMDRGGDPLVTACGIREHFDYYLARAGDVRVANTLCKAKQIPAFKQSIEDAGERPIVMMWAHYGPQPDVKALLQSDFEVVDDEKFVGARVLWLKKPAPPPLPEASPGPAPQAPNPQLCHSSGTDSEAWSRWSRTDTLHQLMVQEGVVKLIADSHGMTKTEACLKERIPVSGTVEISGHWATALEQGRFGQVSVRFLGTDNKWVKGDGPDKAFQMVRTTKVSQPWKDLQRTFKVPATAKTMRLCMELKADKATLSLRDLCIKTLD